MKCESPATCGGARLQLASFGLSNASASEVSVVANTLTVHQWTGSQTGSYCAIQWASNQIPSGRVDRPRRVQGQPCTGPVPACSRCDSRVAALLQLCELFMAATA